MSFPEDLRYTKDHEWVRLEGRTATFGITDHAQEQLGDIVYLELPEEGDEVKQGETFGVVESTKAVSDLYAPMSGRVAEVNEPLVDTPETINTDPYGDGWLVRIEVSKPSEIERLMDAEEYAKFVAESE
ncbi:MAG: glycine cleavage system protein GcvH [Myxococcales bacterium]|nr:MAG: glycine cleavage system protein GcvH [Myxococcales bacterium]